MLGNLNEARRARIHSGSGSIHDVNARGTELRIFAERKADGGRCSGECRAGRWSARDEHQVRECRARNREADDQQHDERCDASETRSPVAPVSDQRTSSTTRVRGGTVHNRPGGVRIRQACGESAMERARLELATFRLQTECSPN